MSKYFDFSSLAMSSVYDEIAFLIYFLVFIFLFVLAIGIIGSLGQWKVFKKAGNNGWAAFIPIYNSYVACQVAGVNTMWVWISLVAPIVTAIITPLAFISTIVSLYFNVILSISMARSFGKSDGYAVGLILLGPIFYLILGFGDSKYLGPRPMNDAILEMFGVKNESNNSSVSSNTNTSTSTNYQPTINVGLNSDNTVKPKYCSACGSVIVDGASYCGNCGNKL